MRMRLLISRLPLDLVYRAGDQYILISWVEDVVVFLYWSKSVSSFQVKTCIAPIRYCCVFRRLGTSELMIGSRRTLTGVREVRTKRTVLTHFPLVGNREGSHLWWK
jgi:hypothetical protein